MEKQQRTLSSLLDKISYMEIRLSDLAQEQGSSTWLTVLSIKRLGFNLSKIAFLGCSAFEIWTTIVKTLSLCKDI